MDRFLRIAIPTMFAGLALALLYAVFSASSKGSNRDPVAKLATGQLLRCTVRAADLCCRSGVGTYNWGFTAESSPDNTSILEQEYGTPVAGKRLTNKLARRRCLVRRGGCHTGGQ